MLLAALCQAQPQPQTVSTPTYNLDFRKQFSTWTWSAGFTGMYSLGGNSSLRLKDRYISKLFRQTTEIDKWRDENSLEVIWENPLGNGIKTSTILNSRVFSDENTFVDFSKHLIAQEVELPVNRHIAVKPALGWAFEEAFGKQDQGWYGKLGLEINKLDMGNYLNYTRASSSIRAFPGRRNQEHTFFTGWSTRLSPYASDSIRVGYQFSESRYYLSPDQVSGVEDPQEQVIINGRFLFNQLRYNFSDRSALAVVTNFKNRSVDQRNPQQASLRKELALENQFLYLFRTPKVNMKMGVFFSQTDNDNPGVNTDVEILQAAFNNSITVLPTESFRMWGRFSYTKIEHNTPSGDDRELVLRNDRDEQRFIIDAGFRKEMSPYFSWDFRGNVYLFHQIYLFASRSANNNWNRIYQLSGGFNHRPNRQLEHRHQIKILANYTVFDFDEILPQIRSFVFRKLIYTDSLKIRLSEQLALETIYQLEVEDNGAFFKRDFSQKVSKEQIAHYGSIFLQHQDFLGFQFRAGLSLFFRKEWQIVSRQERKRVRDFRSISPRITLTYPASRRLLFYATYAPIRSDNYTRSFSATAYRKDVQYFATGNLSLRYTF